MTRCSIINFRLSIMSKWLTKHISTKVFFKFTIRKTHVYIDLRWPWIWKQYFYSGISNDGRTKIIVLPSFQLAKLLNSQNRNETEFINEIWHKIFIWILMIPVGIIQVSTPRKWSILNNFSFLHYFISLHNYWTPSTWKSLVPLSWAK